MDQHIGWLAFLDAYGASSRVAAGRGEELVERLEKVRHLILRKKKPVDFFYNFGDSFILFRPVPELLSRRADEHAKFFFDFTEVITETIEFGASQGLLFRGALAYGPCTVSDNFCLGTPILKCVALEKKLYLPMVFVPHRELILAKISDGVTWRREFIPLKDGTIAGHSLLPQPYTDLIDHVRARVDETLIHGPEDVAQVFYDYLDFLTRKSNTASSGSSAELRDQTDERRKGRR